jgi:hypothetical protein
VNGVVTARRRLNELADAGEVRRRDVGDAALWMLAEDGDARQRRR